MCCNSHLAAVVDLVRFGRLERFGRIGRIHPCCFLLCFGFFPFLIFLCFSWFPFFGIYLWGNRYRMNINLCSGLATAAAVAGKSPDNSIYRVM